MKKAILSAVLVFSLAAAWADSPRVARRTPQTAQQGACAVPGHKLLLNRCDAPWNCEDVKLLRSKAEAALKLKPVAVTDKEIAPPSGDRHDYMSFGPYWWPDPSKPDGLPYIRRDGEVNPESRRNSDRPRLETLRRTVATLAGARYRLADADDGLGRRAGEAGVRWLKRFFLDPETAMNPNLEYGQSIPGICKGRGIGIIDTYELADFLLDAIILLHESGDLSDGDFAGLRRWFGRYLDWLTTSANGIKERGEHNNHGTAYDVQVAAFSLFCGRREQAAKTLDGMKARRIDTQIRSDGSQPHELARTRALSYSTMNAALFADALVLGAQTGVDLWGYESAGGGSIRKALEWMIPYWERKLEWKWRQITKFDERGARWPLAVYRRFMRETR